MSEIDAAVLSFAEVVRRHEADEPMLVLTDEEWWVVTAGVPEEDRLVPLEVVAALDPAERDARGRAALRSLQARGLVAVPPDAETDAESGLTELEVSGAMSIVLHALAHEGCLTIAASTHDGAERRRVIVTLGDAGVIEHSFGAGIHEFRLWSPRRACLELAALIDPGGVAGDEDVELDHAPADAERAQPDWLPDDPSSTATLRRTKDGEPALELLWSGDPGHGLILISGEAQDGDGQLTHLRARALSKGTLLGLCAQVLDLAGAVRGR